MDNSEKLATQGTQDKDEQNKNTTQYVLDTQALVSFKKYMPPPLPYFKVSIYSFP